MATKIETDLTPEELMEFFRRIAQTRGGVTGPRIQAVCAEFGVTISKETANEYRKGLVGEYLKNLSRNTERAKEIVEIVKGGVQVSDANAVKLQMAISDKLDGADPAMMSPDELNAISMANERMRASDRNAQRLASDLAVAKKKIEVADTQLRLRDEQIAKLTGEREEREAKLRAVAKQVQRANNAPAASADDVRAAAVAEIDRIMGITPRKK